MKYHYLAFIVFILTPFYAVAEQNEIQYGNCYDPKATLEHPSTWCFPYKADPNRTSTTNNRSNTDRSRAYEQTVRSIGGLLDQMNIDQAAAEERAQRTRANHEIEVERSRQEEAANNARKQYEEQQAQKRLRSAEQDTSLNPWGNGDSRKSNNKSKSNNEIYAPHLANNCVTVSQHGKGISDNFKIVKNNCGMPVKVLVCFYGYKGATRDCTTDDGWGTVGTIPAGGSEQTADIAGVRWRARYQVCDMRNDILLCVRK